MVKINKVYTKKGDKGKTRLVGGALVAKDHARVEAYGTVDELNSLVGTARCFNGQKKAAKRRNKFDIILQVIQQWLFDLGSELATDPAFRKKKGIPYSITEKHVLWLEEVMDAMNEELKPLESFILPGGGPVSSSIHQCRTVCRRAERRMLTLHKKEKLSPWAIPFINRLSDTFFVFGRWVGQSLGEKEVLWEPRAAQNPDWRWK